MAERMDTTELRRALYNKVRPWIQRREDDRDAYLGGGWMSQDEWDKWDKRKPLNDEERKEFIKQHGLPAIIQYHEDKHGHPDDDFFTLSVRPITGWTSLDSMEGAKLRRAKHEDYNPLHVSIGHRGDYQGVHYDYYMNELEKIKQKYKEPKRHLFEIEDFGQGGAAYLGWDDPVQRDLHMMFNYGRYGKHGPRAVASNYQRYQDARPHISM